jgi:hypothetical protein
MGAFVAAVGRHSGPVAAVRAAEHWIELLESIGLPLLEGALAQADDHGF